MRKEPVRSKIFLKVLGCIIIAAPCIYWFQSPSDVWSDSQNFPASFSLCLVHRVHQHH